MGRALHGCRPVLGGDLAGRYIQFFLHARHRCDCVKEWKKGMAADDAELEKSIRRGAEELKTAYDVERKVRSAGIVLFRFFKIDSMCVCRPTFTACSCRTRR